PPHDRIVARYSSASLDEASEHRISPMDIDRGGNATDFFGSQHFRVDAVHSNGVAPAPKKLELMLAIRQRDLSALAQHHIEIELAAKALIQLQRMVVESRHD